MMNVDVKPGSDGVIIVRVTQPVKSSRGWKFCKFIVDTSFKEINFCSSVNDNHSVIPFKYSK